MKRFIIITVSLYLIACVSLISIFSTDTSNKMVLVNKCVGNIYSTIYRCWYPQIFINIGIQVIA